MLDSIVGLAYFFVIGANIVLAIVILYRGINSRINLSFSIMMFFIAFWVASSYLTIYFSGMRSEQLATFWFRMRYLTIIPVPSLFLYFSLIFPENKLKDPWKQYLVFLPVPILYVFQFSGLIAIGMYPLRQGGMFEQVYGPFVGLFAGYYLLYFLLTFVNLLNKYFRSRGISRVQVQYVFVGTMIPVVVGGLGNLFLPLFGIYFSADILHVIGPLSTIFIAVMIASAIIKYRFMGFNYVVGRGLVYTILASFITALYFGFLYVMAKFFQTIGGGSYSFFIGILFFFVFALIFDPIRERLQRFVDMFLFRSKFDYEKTLKQMSSAMNFISNRERLLNLTAKLITKRMRLSGTALFIYDEKNGEFVIKGSGGICKAMLGKSLPLDNPLVEHIEETRYFVMKSEVEKFISDVFISDYEKEKSEKVLSEMKALNITLCVPSVLKGTVIAFLALGSKISGDPFDEEDLAFLSALANQSAIFLENFILVEREKQSAKAIAEAETRQKYAAMLEKINTELLETKEGLIKSERLATLTMLTVTLQNEINAPLDIILKKADTISDVSRHPASFSAMSLSDDISSIESQAKKIREILRNLANITEPIVKDYPVISN